jgi:Protein of unknown function (DUF3237)
MSEIRTAFLFAVTITVAPAQIVGATPIGERRNVPVTGGIFEGKRLRGIVMPGGSDWIVVRGDGVWQLDVRLPLQTDDGALINMTYKGFRHGPAAVLDRLNRGETVDPSEYYFRTAPFFETAAAKYAWLNGIVAVATGHRTASGPTYQVHEVL